MNNIDLKNYKIESINHFTFIDYLNEIEKDFLDCITSQIQKHINNGAKSEQLSLLRHQLEAFTQDMQVKYFTKPILEIKYKNKHHKNLL